MDQGSKYGIYVLTYFMLLASTVGILMVLNSDTKVQAWEKNCNILTAVCSIIAVAVQSCSLVRARTPPSCSKVTCFAAAPLVAFVLLFEAHPRTVKLALAESSHLRIVMGIESISSWTQVYVMAHIIKKNWADMSIYYNLGVSLAYGTFGGIYALYSLRSHVNQMDYGVLNSDDYGVLNSDDGAPNSVVPGSSGDEGYI